MITRRFSSKERNIQHIPKRDSRFVIPKNVPFVLYGYALPPLLGYRNRPNVVISKEVHFESTKRLFWKRFLDKRADNYIPKGIKVKYLKPDSDGYFYSDKRLIVASEIDSLGSLYNFLHECGHANLHMKSSKPKYVQEFEAEKFAQEAMKKEGLTVPEAEIAWGKLYIKDCVIKAILHGAKSINKEVWRYAKMEGLP